ncbi:MAG TPA: DUF3240 family protein [Rhizomicrobium sp.]|nr:DUF3240 family protein [Rhizomicrobium sp.]
MTQPEHGMVKLSLVCPAILGEQLVEYLLESEWLDGGFTTLATQGHGRDFANASLREKVRGRVQSLTVVAILPAGNATALLDALRARFRNPHLVWWTEPVLGFGDFA